MTLNQINKRLAADGEIFNLLWRTSPVLIYYYELNSYFTTLQSLYRDENSNAQSIQAALKEFLTRTRTKTNEVDVGTFFISINDLRRSMDEKRFQSSRFLRVEAELRSTLDRVWDAFNSLIRAPNDYSRILRCMDLISQIDSTISTISSEQKVLASFLAEIEKPISASESESSMLFQIFDEAMSMSDFVIKLESLNTIYVCCLDVLRISESEFPLRASQIEFGSLFSKVVGSKKAIGLMKTIVGNLFDHLFKKFTMKDRLSASVRN